jgi:type I restriction enzyme S subunit
MAGNTAFLGTGRTGGRDATTGIIPGRCALAVGRPETPTPHNWKWTALSSVAQLESGHTPSRKHPEYWNGAVPWIGIKDATENHGRTIDDTHQHISQEGLNHSSARLLPSNTVCLSRTASVGYVVVMGRPMATSQDFINWICGPNLDPHFLKYVLFSETEALWRFASGTTHQTIYYPEAKAFHVCLPPLPEQKRIAHILGSLDDKIELNRRMNKTLEEMARALFKSWFIGFDPVVAKSEGRPPEGMDAETAKLFPSSFEDSALGRIPKGWKVGKLSDVAIITMGQSPQGETFNEDGNGIVFYQGRAEFGWRYPTRRLYTTDPKRMAQANDILMSVRAPVGDINVANEACCIGRGLSAIRSKNGQSSFMLYAMDSLKEQLDVYDGEGTVFGCINKDALGGLKILMPPESVMIAFEMKASYLDSMIFNKSMQSRNLATLRDTLLPNLLNGDVNVST